MHQGIYLHTGYLHACMHWYRLVEVRCMVLLKRQMDMLFVEQNHLLHVYHNGRKYITQADADRSWGCTRITYAYFELSCRKCHHYRPIVILALVSLHNYIGRHQCVCVCVCVCVRVRVLWWVKVIVGMRKLGEAAVPPPHHACAIGLYAFIKSRGIELLCRTKGTGPELCL